MVHSQVEADVRRGLAARSVVAVFADIGVRHDPRPRRAPAKVGCWGLIGLLTCASAGAGIFDSASPPPATSPLPECLFCTDYIRRLGQDAEQVFTAPFRWEKDEWHELTRDGLLVLGTMALLNRPVQKAIQHHRGATSERIAARFEPFGAEYSFAVLGGFYVAGRVVDDPVSQAVARDGLAASIIAAGIVTPALKAIVGRSRPRQNEGTYHFSPFSGNSSFPSGHATQASRSPESSRNATGTSGVWTRLPTAWRHWSVMPGSSTTHISCQT